MRELIVDHFARDGGALTGIEFAVGRTVQQQAAHGTWIREVCNFHVVEGKKHSDDLHAILMGKWYLKKVNEVESNDTK